MQSQESEALQARYRLACELAKAGAELAFEYYQQREVLTVDHKGDDLQDVVSVADKRVEAFVKQRIQSAFPEDGFLGEESGARLPDARVLWVVDPIDGTSCFLNGLHTWCLSLAIVADGEPVIGVVYDPNHRELFHALRGHGAWLNDAPIRPHPATMVKEGVMGVGTSHRVTPADFLPFLQALLSDGGMFIRNGSGALMSAWAAAGRLIGYYEPHMNPWDALPGLVLMREAGGASNDFLAQEGIQRGNRQPNALPAAEKDDPTTITLTLTGQAISDYVLYTVTITSFTDEPHQSVRPPTCGEPPMSGIIAFFRASPPKAGAAFDEHRFRRVRWQTFIAMTLAYVTFYVCRLSFTVAKSALVELGITPTELGMIGSTLFFSYAIGKLVNGFIADHANVVRYMSLGLLLSAGMNLMMGMTTNALLLAIFWGINGWAQSMGVGPCAVSLARWYGVKERGTFYGIWSTAHNIGEAVTYMVIAAVIAGFGWQMGYLSTAALGAAGVVLLVLFMHDSPQSSGFPSINVIRDEPQEEVEARGSVFKNQLLALRNPALWTLALASAFMYIDRYAVNSWGIFFLEQDKAYSTLEASGIIGVNAIAGIAGTIIAGMLSDRFFPRNRSVMAGFISLLNTAGFALMLWSPHNYYTDILAMIIFGATIGALTCFLGGLIAVDISSRKAAGAALGTIGIASYAGAGLGEFLTGIIIDKTAILENGKTLYDFSTLALFWVGTGLGSALLCFTTAAIVARRHAVERQTSFSS